MSDFDDVLERLLVDPGFKAALAADPGAALARYRLSPDEAELLRAQVTGDTGGQGKVEERTSKASMFGLLSHLGGVGDAIHHAADHAGGAQDVGAQGVGTQGGGGQHVTYEATTTTYQSTTYYSSGGGQVPVDDGQGGMLGRNLGSLDLGHGAAPAGADHLPGQGLAGVYESSQGGGGAHTVGAAFEQPGGGGAQAVGGTYDSGGGPGGQAVGGVYGSGGSGGQAVGGAFGQQPGQGGLSAADQQYDERDYSSSSSSSQVSFSSGQGHGGLSAAPDQAQSYGGPQSYGGLSVAPDQPQGQGGLSAAPDPGQGYGGVSAAPQDGGGAGALGQGGGSVVGRASVGDYHVNVDVDGDGHWDDHVVVARSDGGVDVLVDSNHDGRVDFIGHDYNRDGILDDAVTDDNHDGTLDSLHIDKNGDGWMDRHVNIDSHEARTYLSRHAAPDDEAR